MEKPATEVARRLADQAEAVCRHYLSKGRREGRYWMVGDIHDAAGQSLYVRLEASPDGLGRAGKWTDAATGEHGDLLDVIAKVCGHGALRETLDEARRFLSLPLPPPQAQSRLRREAKAPTGTPEAARRLLAATQAIGGSLAETYLRNRSLADLRGHEALRFHPRCWYRASSDDAPDIRSAWPALIAAVTDLGGHVTGVHRTWLDPATIDKAPVAYPRRAMGALLGNGVRFGAADAVMAAGEGLETVLSLKRMMAPMPMIAALSSAHLAALRFPPSLRRLYVACDDDPAGYAALAALTERGAEAGVEVAPLAPSLGDFNEDLRLIGFKPLQASLRLQLRPEDVGRFLIMPR